MPRFALLEDEDDDALLYGTAEAKVESLDDSFEFTASTMTAHARYFFDESLSDDLDGNDNCTSCTRSPIMHKWKNEPPIGQSTQQALLSARISTEITPMKTLIKYAIQDASGLRQQQQQQQQQHERGGHHDAAGSTIRGLQDAMDALSLIVKQIDTTSQDKLPSPVRVELPAAYIQQGDAERRIREEILEEKRKYDKQHEETRRDIKALLDEKQRDAEARAAKQRFEEKEATAKYEAEQSRLRNLELLKKEKEEQEAMQRDAAKEETRQKEVQQKLQDDLRLAEKAAQDQAERSARDYVTRAEKLVVQLKQLQESVEPFDQSKVMSRRRLEMKKIVNGKVNTLSEDVEKIRTVAAEVSAAIAKAKEEDFQIQEQIKSGNTEFTMELAKGKRYFVDLLCRKVIVRVQAEGFNGLRGDGYPLAGMLAIVAVEHKDIVPVLAAHVYTVCPTAIPRLPKVTTDATEDDVMESLGMLKGKDGQYETFERFLARTEGLVSMVSNIMSSQPADHNLFGGNAGAIKWLSRFLSELPEPPTSPLPLITAPVLDAFLTGSGHMLANAYPDEFQKYLEVIEKTCIPRLDEGVVGKPSSTRLQKTLRGGFDSFKNTLPIRALGELYHGSTETGTRKPISSAPGLSSRANNNSISQQKQQQQPQQQPVNTYNPFGGSGGAAASPFGIQSSSSTPPTPFGTRPAAPSPSPFGGKAENNQSSTLMPNASFYDSNSSLNRQAPSRLESSEDMQSDASNDMQAASVPPLSFGGASTTGSLFGSSTSAAPAPVAPGGFGSSFMNLSQQSSFGGGSLASQQPSSLFGAPASATPMVASSFGSTGPSQSPFGTSTPAAPFGSPTPTQTTIFGGGSTATPFGAPSTVGTPFGGPSPSPFGVAPGPSPFGGDTVKTSLFTSAPSASFGGGISTPFGVSSAPNPSPFGNTAPLPSPFGNQGFGGGSGGSAFGVSTPGNSMFGATPTQSNTPFGTPQTSLFSTPFGSNAAPSATPFGSPGFSNFYSPVPDNRQPCKFFSRGQCRYGNNCKFSHDIQQQQQQGSNSGNVGGVGNTFSDPFGGGPRR